MAGGSGEFTMIPVGEPGPPFRPEHEYFSVALVAVHVRAGGFLGSQKFAPVMWGSVTHYAFDGENGRKRLCGLFPAAQQDRPEFSRNDRVTVADVLLIPRIIAREELEVDFTMGTVKEKDFLAGVLKAATDIASSPAASFISQIVPGGAAVVEGTKSAAAAATSVNDSLNGLLGSDKIQSLGRYMRRLSAPMPSGLFAFVDRKMEGARLTFDAATNTLRDADGPVKGSYAIVRLQREATRPDWMTLPDLTQAWQRIREAKINGGDVAKAIELFALTATTSPDLTPDDAMKLSAAAKQRFAPELAGQESADSGDPGSMAEALEFFVGGSEESAEIGATPYLASGRFARSLEMLLRHEGGYVDHPLDKGGPTNKGVTKAVYDSYRAAKGLPAGDVRDLKDDELKEIYYEGYWRPARCNEMPSEAMAALMFDAAVNHGPKRAVRLLQQGAGMPVAKCDGVWGNETKRFVTAAAARAVELVDACLLARERFYREIVRLNPSQAAFIKGWMNRVAGLRAYVQPLLAAAPPAGETESALFDEGPSSVYLRAGEADFESLAKQADTTARAAE